MIRKYQGYLYQSMKDTHLYTTHSSVNWGIQVTEGIHGLPKRETDSDK